MKSLRARARLWVNESSGKCGGLEWPLRVYSVGKHVNMLALVRSEEKADSENAAA